MRNSLPRKNNGAALLVALVMLLVITLLGVSSMKSSIFQEKMSLNSRADAITFQTAESAIEAVLDNARNPGTKSAGIAVQALQGTKIDSCLSPTGNRLTSGKCSSGQKFNSRTAEVNSTTVTVNLQAQAETEYTGTGPSFGTDVDVATFYHFDTDGKARYDTEGVPYAHHNKQNWKHLGPANAGQGKFTF